LQVIHAIARSRTEPERAETLVERLESMFKAGEIDFQPDVVCYDALINAFGWSSEKGKGRKAYEIFQKMLDLFKSGSNLSCKPDMITCNSVLNAAAYEEANNEAERTELMDIVVNTFESFQSAAPKFGWPNHITYATLLMAIAKHTDDSDKRYDLAETTFWQCAESGNVSVLVINQLHKTLPWERFANLMGPALFSDEGEKLSFAWRDLSRKWTRFAPKPKQRIATRPSQKHPSIHVTKSTIAKQVKDQGLFPWKDGK
jgi:hypothetical protein